ncbi:MAG: hypothetical protein Q7Q71_09105 [Verrucomicrobiota bacterium JB023]|nr:hypothetical protein [Verrucomicrobiota bacterium JB023]
MSFSASLGRAEVVEVARGPGRTWKERETRVLADLPRIARDGGTSLYGGERGKVMEPSGFFRTDFREGRWWLLDPEGHPFVSRGMVSVKTIRTQGARQALKSQFGSEEEWAGETLTLLKENGFNTLGPWCDELVLEVMKEGTAPKLAYTRRWNFMATYGKKRGGTYQKAGHRGYPGDCPFIFDPGFAQFCDEHARQLAAEKDDPWLLGHFTDNELPWHIEMLDRYLALPADDPGHQAARAWMKREKRARPFTPEDRAAFVGYAAETYFRIVCSAIKKHDPNHLVLGSRFHGSALRIPELFEAAGRHLDVVSVNYYHAWTPEQQRLETWSSAARRPILITEWYAKAVDSGLGNRSGAGWLVKSQEDRARFYQNYTLGLLESRVCVGWHWFRYSDNDPAQKGVDPSNLDANKGIVSNRYEPYQPLVDGMKEINERSDQLIKYFDQKKTK